jgi:FKBP-type peptidyl-prolyl cis-trans isomerase
MGVFGAGENKESSGMKWFGAILAAALAATPAMAADPALSPQANTNFLTAFAQKPGSYRTPTGLEYRIIHSGFGARPVPIDTVDVYYKGALINGRVFDQTEPGFPANFPLGKGQLIQGWTEALLLMREGDEWEIVIPPNLGYGMRGAGDAIPPNQTLVFDLTLVKVTHPTPEELQREREEEDKAAGH